MQPVDIEAVAGLLNVPADRLSGTGSKASNPSQLDLALGVHTHVCMRFGTASGLAMILVAAACAGLNSIISLSASF